jgi:site-specific DNA-methyltransferase (adenine-specific)
VSGAAGSPVCEVIGPATLYLGDCLSVLPTLPQADVMVTDPPYGINYVFGGGGQGRTFDGHGNVLAAIQLAGDTRPIHGDDRDFDPTPILGSAPRVLLFGADHFRARLPHGGRFLAWDKSVGVGPADSFTDCEFAWSNVPTLKRNVYRHLWKGLCRKKTTHDFFGWGQRRGHVSQKPVGLMRWCIETLRCPPGGVVLDPYMGSGSTGVAAITLGMRFVGIEIAREHFDTACERIRTVVSELGLKT